MSDLIARLPPRRQLATIADQLLAFAAAELPLTGPDLLLLARRMREIAARLPAEKPAPVLRLARGGRP